MFCPEEAKKALGDVALSDYVLGEKKMKDSASWIAKQRKKVRAMAMEAAEASVEAFPVLEAKT